MIDLISQFLSVMSGTAAMMLAVPIGVFCLECLLAVLPQRTRRASASSTRRRVAVLIPAHNEAEGIAATLNSLQSALAQSDEMVVIADNCTDETKEIAINHGARVVERFDSFNRGKGHALNFGIERLSQTPPDVLVVLDADCQISPDTIDHLARRVMDTGRPVQAHNLCVSTTAANGDSALASLGHRFCCLIRPTGAARLGMPCSLMGTGMAFPWALIERQRFDGGHLAEDKLLGINLTLAGFPPVFCAEAQVCSVIPDHRDAFLGQRKRWEHGHLRLAMTQIPRLIKGAVRRASVSSLWMALDICIPPLALLVLALIATATIAVCSWGFGGGLLPLLVLLAEGVLLGAAVIAGWLRFCRRDLPLSVFVGIPSYIFRKLPLYASFFVGKGQRAWIRTPRSATSETPLPS